MGIKVLILFLLIFTNIYTEEIKIIDLDGDMIELIKIVEKIEEKKHQNLEVKTPKNLEVKKPKKKNALFIKKLKFNIFTSMNFETSNLKEENLTEETSSINFYTDLTYSFNSWGIGYGYKFNFKKKEKYKEYKTIEDSSAKPYIILGIGGEKGSGFGLFFRKYLKEKFEMEFGTRISTWEDIEFKYFCEFFAGIAETELKYREIKGTEIKTSKLIDRYFGISLGYSF